MNLIRSRLKVRCIGILLVILNSLFSPHICKAQSPFNKWRTGKVTLADGQKFEGDLFYKLKSEELEVKIESEIKTYKAKDVASFEIRNRDLVEVYLSLPFDLNDENSPSVFFQLLMESNDFYFLSKKEPEVTNTYPSSPGGAMTMSSYQPEILFFLTKEGKVEIYSSSNPGLTKRTLLNGQKMYVNIDLLKTLTDTHFDRLQAYAEENRLSFEKKNDLLVILDYYQSLK